MRPDRTLSKIFTMNFLVIFFLPYFFSICTASEEDYVLSIPLMRRESPLQRMARENIHPKIIESIYKRAAIKYGKKPSNGTAPVPLFKYLDNEFYAEILIGHPGQKFNVAFDTVWANSWVLSILCPITQMGCIGRNKYDSSRSSSYIPNGKPFEVRSGSFHLKGKFSTDLFHVGQINVTNQTFAEIDTVSFNMVYSKLDGVVGLAFSKYSVDGVIPLFYNMYKQGVIKKQVFSFYMNRDPSTTKGGTLMFGGVQSKHYLGNFTELPINPDTGIWSFSIDKIFVTTTRGPINFCKNGCSAYADTSGNVIQGPSDEIDEVNKAIEARAFYFGRYSVPCGNVAKLPKITFVLDGKNFTLGGEDYVQKVSWHFLTVCLSSFAKLDNTTGNTWAIGGAFLARYYVKFDMEKKIIGFADARL